MENFLKPIEMNSDEVLAVSGGGTISSSGTNANNSLNYSGNDNSFNKTIIAAQPSININVQPRSPGGPVSRGRGGVSFDS